MFRTKKDYNARILINAGFYFTLQKWQGNWETQGGRETAD